jgi:CheY-like chemotaxis protein
MVVDDEEELAILFGQLIESMGLGAISFIHPLQAFEHFKNNKDRLSLIITDLRMPGLSGIQLAKRIREYNQETKILLVTAFIADQVLKDESFKEAQISEVIEKPKHFNELKQRIAQLLSA